MSNATHSIIVHALYHALPPPRLTTPEALRMRMDSAIALVASLVPVNEAEVLLAANWVGATMQAMDTQAEVHQPDLPWDRKMQCLSQVNAMQRTAKALLEQLRLMQALRIKREGIAPDPDQAAWTEHRVTQTMTDALGRLQDAIRTAQTANRDQNPGQNPADRNFETNLTTADPSHPVPGDPKPEPEPRTDRAEPGARITVRPDASDMTGEPDRHAGSDHPMGLQPEIADVETDSGIAPTTADKPPLTASRTPWPRPAWVQPGAGDDHGTGHAARRLEYADAGG